MAEKQAVVASRCNRTLHQAQPWVLISANVDILIRIKRCALAGRLRLTNKARTELDYDDLDINDVRESLLNAVAIYKTIRSANPITGKREHLYIIQSPNLSGIALYTKGKLVMEDGVEVFFLLVSSKRAL